MIFFHFFMSWLVSKWAKLRGFETLTSLDELDDRFRTCATCEFFENGFCNVCKCLVMSKIMLTTEECPKKKWQRVWRKRVTIKE